MLKIIRSKRICQTAVVTGSQRKKWEYLKDEITELAMNSKNKNITYQYRVINE
jgi:hypothetical protein